MIVQPISIHASREGGDQNYRAESPEITISIHASREGGDLKGATRVNIIKPISIHASREGGDSKGAQRFLCEKYK